MYNILILDDEEKHVFATMGYLESYGFRSFGTTSAKNALNIIKKIKTDLIIIDIIMPSIDGYSFVELLKADKNYKKIPFIFLTALGITKDRIKGYKLGCSAYVPKPFAPEELITIITNILKRREALFLEVYSLLGEVNTTKTKMENPDKLCPELSLTPGEMNVLTYILQGLQNKEIACTLNTSLRNVEKYVTKLLSKTNTKNRINLVNYCYLNKNTFKANDGIRTRE